MYALSSPRRSPFGYVALVSLFILVIIGFGNGPLVKPVEANEFDGFITVVMSLLAAGKITAGTLSLVSSSSGDDEPQFPALPQRAYHSELNVVVDISDQKILLNQLLANSHPEKECSMLSLQSMDYYCPMITNPSTAKLSMMRLTTGITECFVIVNKGLKVPMCQNVADSKLQECVIANNKKYDDFFHAYTTLSGQVTQHCTLKTSQYTQARILNATIGLRESSIKVAESLEELRRRQNQFVELVEKGNKRMEQGFDSMSKEMEDLARSAKISKELLAEILKYQTEIMAVFQKAVADMSKQLGDLSGDVASLTAAATDGFVAVNSAVEKSTASTVAAVNNVGQAVENVQGAVDDVLVVAKNGTKEMQKLFQHSSEQMENSTNAIIVNVGVHAASIIDNVGIHAASIIDNIDVHATAILANTTAQAEEVGTKLNAVQRKMEKLEKSTSNTWTVCWYTGFFFAVLFVTSQKATSGAWFSAIASLIVCAFAEISCNNVFSYLPSAFSDVIDYKSYIHFVCGIFCMWRVSVAFLEYIKNPDNSTRMSSNVDPSVTLQHDNNEILKSIRTSISNLDKRLDLIEQQNARPIVQDTHDFPLPHPHRTRVTRGRRE